MHDHGSVTVNICVDHAATHQHSVYCKHDPETLITNMREGIVESADITRTKNSTAKII